MNYLNLVSSKWPLVASNRSLLNTWPKIKLAGMVPAQLVFVLIIRDIFVWQLLEIRPHPLSCYDTSDCHGDASVCVCVCFP